MVFKDIYLYQIYFEATLENSTQKMFSCKYHEHK